MAPKRPVKPRTVTGRWRVPTREHARFSHSDGWNAALDNALSKTHWDPKGEFRDVRVEFIATVDVVNPGSIVEYCVKLHPPGG